MARGSPHDDLAPDVGPDRLAGRRRALAAGARRIVHRPGALEGALARHRPDLALAEGAAFLAHRLAHVLLGVGVHVAPVMLPHCVDRLKRELRGPRRRPLAGRAQMLDGVFPHRPAGILQPLGQRAPAAPRAERPDPRAERVGQRGNQGLHQPVPGLQPLDICADLVRVLDIVNQQRVRPGVAPLHPSHRHVAADRLDAHPVVQLDLALAPDLPLHVAENRLDLAVDLELPSDRAEPLQGQRAIVCADDHHVAELAQRRAQHRRLLKVGRLGEAAKALDREPRVWAVDAGHEVGVRGAALLGMPALEENLMGEPAVGPDAVYQ